MKRCPECRRDYYDDTLLYCLDDGNALLEGPATVSSGDEPATAILDITAPPNEVPTRAQISTTNETAILPDSLQPRPQSSAEYLLGRMKGRKLTVVLAMVALVVVIGGGGFGIYKWISSTKSPAAMRTPKITRLTNSGRVVRSAISPDGKYVAYIQTGEAEKPSIWIRQVAAASDAQIVPEEDGASYGGITFAPDGEFVYFVKRIQGNGSLWRTPILGGAARKLNIEHIDGARISLSPDGKQIAFDRNSDGGDLSVVITNLDGLGERTLSKKKGPEFMGPGPAWSPDGLTIVHGGSASNAGRLFTSIRVDDGSDRPFGERVWAGNKTPDLAWLNDGSGLLVTAAEDAAINAQIWFLGVGDNVGQQVTGDLSEYRSLGLTANSATICAVRTETTMNLWVADVSDLENPRPITSGSERNDGDRGLSWTPDGKVLYYSDAGGGQNIWITASDGSGSKQVTSQARRNRDAHMTPDGRYVVWESNRGEGNNIWRMDLDGGNPKQLTQGGVDYRPWPSTDGKWVIFARTPRDANGGLWRVSIDGGDATPIRGTEKSPFGFFSQDGTRIFFLAEGSQKNLVKLVSVPFDGGEPLTSFELPEGTKAPTRMGPDGRSITYVRQIDGQDNIWSQPLEGGAPKQLTHYKSLDIHSFAWSRDGKKIVMSRRSSASDVVLIKDFR